MQKKLIALAVAGLASTAAFAQSNVTIYGVVDAGYVHASSDTFNSASSVNKNGIDSGNMAGSRLGFKGEEALGNGLSAVFALEYGLSIDTNAGVGTALARQQYVGLKSAKLGQVALGRQYAPGYLATVRNDAMAAAGVSSALAALNTAGVNTIQGGSNARWNNAITYTSPKFAGFTASAIYSYGEASVNSTGNGGAFGAGLNYANGPLNLDLVYQSRQDTTAALLATTAGISTASGLGGDANGGDKSVNEWFVGGSYDLKVVKLFATYQDQNDNNGTSANEASNKVWSVGVTVPVFGNGKIHATYADISWDSTGAGDSDSWALGYTHALSKRTTLYTFFNQTDNDRTARNAAGTVAGVRFLGEKNNVVSAGITHTF